MTVPVAIEPGALNTYPLGNEEAVLRYPGNVWRFKHTCHRFHRHAGTIICAPLLSSHTVTITDGKVTVTPSIHCPDCGLHAFVTNSALHHV